MKNFMLKYSKLTSNLKKKHYLMLKTVKKKYFVDSSIVKVCVLQY